MLNNGVWTPWDMARFGVVQEYDSLRLRNDREGIGNGHLLPTSEFVCLMNESDSTFDPYLYMEEKQRTARAPAPAPAGPAISESVKSNDDDSQEQKSFETSLVAVKSDADDSQEQKSFEMSLVAPAASDKEAKNTAKNRLKREKMKIKKMQIQAATNGVWTPWDMARFGALQQYDLLRLRNDKEGIGNGHLPSRSKFVSLMNESKSTFDPYRYMEEMQLKHPALSESVKSGDDSQEQKSFEKSVAVKSDDDSQEQNFFEKSLVAVKSDDDSREQKFFEKSIVAEQDPVASKKGSKKSAKKKLQKERNQAAASVSVKSDDDSQERKSFEKSVAVKSDDDSQERKSFEKSLVAEQDPAASKKGSKKSAKKKSQKQRKKN